MIRAFKGSVFSALLFFCVSVFAQKPLYQSYSWSDTPQLHTITKESAAFPAVLIEHQRMMELTVPQLTGPASYYTEHKIIHINSDAGVEKLNKVAIPMHNGRELVDLKVRAIGADGKVTNFRKENMKELQNVDGYRNYKIFAVEGITVGGEIEYIYTVKSNPQAFGREMIQQDIPVMEAGFIMLFPKRFEFQLKVYNKNVLPKYTSYDDARNSAVISLSNIPALDEEEYSMYRSNLVRVDYRMSESGGQSSMTWDNFAQRLVSSSTEPNGSMKVTKLLKQLKIDQQSDEEKVRLLERHIKTSFSINAGGNEEYETLKEVVANKVANERGFLKLYIACLQALELNFDLVFGCNRDEGKLDPDFATPLDIREALIFIPKLNKYLVPANKFMRLGASPDAIAESSALFVPSKNPKSYMFKTIKPLPYDLNTMGVKATIVLNEGTATIAQENFWQGSRGALYRGIHYTQKDAVLDEFMKDVTLSAIDNFKIIDRKVEGEALVNSDDPATFFKVKTTYTAPSLVQRAGDDYLVSVGKIIGKQSELYQERERQSDVSFHGTSNYNHDITIEIPEGYKCTGFEAAKIDKKVMLNDNAVMYFQSNYKIEGNKVVLTVNEVYKVLTLPKDKYEEFRGVVNSAADFSKLVLVLSRN